MRRWTDICYVYALHARMLIGARHMHTNSNTVNCRLVLCTAIFWSFIYGVNAGVMSLYLEKKINVEYHALKTEQMKECLILEIPIAFFIPFQH